MTATNTATGAPTIGGLPITSVYVAVPTLAEDLRIGDMVRWEWDAAAAAAQEAAAPEGTRLVICREPYDLMPIADLRIRSYARDEPAVVAVPGNADYPARFTVGRLSEIVPVYVRPEEISTPRGHGQRISSHNPTRRGWYTDPGGWDVACACGWRAEGVVDGARETAVWVWSQHKAEVLNRMLAHRRAYPAEGQARVIRYRYHWDRRWRWRLEYNR